EVLIEDTTWWDFPSHASWNRIAHTYPGNFAAQVARNLICRYSRPGDLILDPFCGSGTSLVEARLLDRRAIGIDLSEKAVRLANAALSLTPAIGTKDQRVVLADSRRLDAI